MVNELAQLFDGARRIIDVTPAAADLQRKLKVPEGVRYETHPPGRIDELMVEAGSVLMCLTGPERPWHTDPDRVEAILSRLPLGSKGLVLVAWPVAELPYHRLLDPLVNASCQVLHAIPLDRVGRHGPHCALLVERVDRLVPPRPSVRDFQPTADQPTADQPTAAVLPAEEPSGPQPTGPGTEGSPVAPAKPSVRSATAAQPASVAPADSAQPGLAVLLRVVNEYILADFAARPARRRPAEPERDRQTERLNQRLADQARELDQLRQNAVEQDQRLRWLAVALAERDVRMRALAEELAKVRERAAVLASSVSFRLGRTMVQGVRHPARTLVSAPRELRQIWQAARTRPAHRSYRPAVPRELRVVPVALPTHGTPDEREVLVIPAAPRLLVPRRLNEKGLVGYEHEALACYLAVLDIAGPGSVYDIGANIGLYAALASALTSRDVRAFEPAPELASTARDVAAVNGLGYLVEELALGAENCTATFYLSDSSDSSNSLAAGFRDSTVQLKVPVETLDSYVARTGAVPAIMKVDTETTEPDVIAGAAKTIAEHRPWILCEVLANRVERRLTEAFAPHGYHWYALTGEVPYREANKIVGDTTHQYLMWLFAPEPPDEAFYAALRKRSESLAACTPKRGAELAVGRATPTEQPAPR